MIKFNNKYLKFITMLLLVFIVLTGCSTTPKVNNSNIPSNEQVTSNTNVDVPDVNESDKDNTVAEADEEQNTDNDNSVSEVVEGQLEVHFIDVGQGDAMLIKQGSHSMVIDAGDNHYGQTVVDYLRQEGIKDLDYVIGTHPHSDHIGGLDDVINSFDVKAVMLPDKIHTTKTFEDVLSAISSKGLKITNPEVGKTFELGEARFTILAPNGSDYSNLNNYSVSVKVEYGNNVFMFTGDAEKQAEEEIVNNGINLKADVLKAGHHGSNTSNTDSFISKVDPDFVVIQVGEVNKYNHPDLDIIQKFENKGIQIFRTDLHGTVIAKSDGNNIAFTTHKGEMPPKTEKVDKPVTVVPSAEPTPTDESNAEEAKSETLISSGFIGTKTSKTVHTPDCRHVPKEENRAYFDDLQQAIEDGYKTCKVCKPN